MPTYVYACTACRRRIEAVRRVAGRDECPACACGAPTERRIVPTMVSVFTPYRAVAFDKETGERPLIKSRAEHEAFLRRNGYEEVGNDASMAPLPQEEAAYRRKQKLKEEAEARAQPAYDFDPDTHHAQLVEETAP